jgi:3-oxoacyl-[acyl-carrier protein] reductase
MVMQDMPNPMTMVGRTILVTGAAQGIGRSIVELALSLGARVAAADLDVSTIDATDKLMPVQCDVSDRDMVEAAVAAALARFGTIDGLVNNAGISRPAMADAAPSARLIMAQPKRGSLGLR